MVSATYTLKHVLKFGTTKNLFGEKSMLIEVDRKRRTTCLIMPESRFKTTWNIIIILLLLYTAIFVPFKIAFISEKDGIIMQIFEWTVDILFGVDIFINFISATVDKNTNTIIFDRKKIAINYIKSWFILDLIACFPFQLLGNLEIPGMTTDLSN